MFRGTITVRSVNSDEEFRRAIDLQARIMVGAGYVEYIDKMKREAKLWPSLKRENVRVALLNGTIVSTFRIFPLHVRIGGVSVPMGGINNVCTHPRHRKRGYMRDLMADAIDHMRRTGTLVSQLHGIPSFYYKFGYAFVGCDYRLAVETRVLVGFRKSLRVRRANQGDLPDIKRLHRATYGERTCTVVRDEKMWSRLRPGIDRVRVVVDGSNRIKGYFWLANRKDIFRVTEVCVDDDEDVIRTMLAECGRLCRLGIFPEAAFDVPPDHPLALYCRGYDAVMETRYKRNSGHMFRILNLDGLFSALEPELSKRLSRSHLTGWRGRFGIETDIGSVFLSISDGRVRSSSTRPRGSCEIIRMPQSLLSQLLVGYRSGSDLSDDTVPAALRDVVAGLFPAGHPFFCPEDMF
jgi:predicted acetyltransferase